MSDGNGLTETLARHVGTLRFEDLPQPVIDKAKAIVLDALGCQLACSTLPHGRLAIDYARREAGRPDSTIIGTDLRTSAQDAALVNGIFGHGDEIDESLLRFGHASAVLVPTALAVSEREHRSGKDMILALVVGYDVAGRISRAGFSLDLLAPRNFQQGSTGGSLAAAMVAGKLLSLGQEELQSALGLAGEQAGGLQTMRTETGHHNKSVHFGIGARNGVVAAYLARAGYGGVFNVLDEPWSIFEAFIPGHGTPAEMTGELGDRFEILMSRFKRYASGSPSHSAIASVLKILKDQGLAPTEIESIVVRMPTLEQRLLSHAKTLNINFEYIIAVAALDGVVSWEQYTEERQKDPVLQDLHARITTQGDPDLDLAQKENSGARPAEVELKTRDGRTFTERLLYPPGHPRNPLSPAELEEKFLYWSTRTVSREQAVELRDTVAHLDEVGDVNDLGKLLRV